MRIDENRKVTAMTTIKKKLTIREVLADEGRVTQSGKGMCSCLFHHEGIPSFSYDDDQGFYNCFSCGSKGSVINLIMECEGKLRHKNITFDKAIDFILATNPEIAKKCGFSSIFIHTEAYETIHRTESGVMDFGFTKPYRPYYHKFTSLTEVARRLRLDLIDSKGDEEILDRIADFVSGCEYAFSEDTIAAIARGEDQFDIEVKQTANITEGALKAFADLM